MPSTARKSLAGLALAGALLLGLGLRLPKLDERPMHGDEANQAVKAGLLFDTGGYRYDPREHHGPTLYYLTLPSLWWRGAATWVETREFDYRIVPVLFGVALILVPVLAADAVGWGAVLWAALLMAVSHAMTYYSRYYIHEVVLVFFAALALAAGKRYWRSRRLGWAVLCGAALGMVHATKETSVLIFAALAGAAALCAAAARFVDGARWDWRTAVPWRHAAAMIAAAALVTAAFHTAFFTHPRGLLDALLTHTTYLARAEGQGSAAAHGQPWHYYLGMLLYSHRGVGPHWSEALIVALACVGGASIAASLRRGAAADYRVHLRRFLLFYTLLLIALYSAIPYKTPWNLLVFLQPLILLAGLGAAVLVRAARGPVWRTAAAVLLLALAGQLARQTRQGTTVYAADVRNPYVYAHTSTAIRRVLDRIDAIAAMEPRGKAMPINIIRPGADFWPLPWYLRAYTGVRYWDRVPPQPDAAIIITANEIAETLDAATTDDYFVEVGALRPNALLRVCIERTLWDAFIETRR